MMQLPTVLTEGRLAVNTHIHLPPNFSAFDTVDQAVSLAAGQGVRVLGVSNYYDYAVYRPFGEHAARHGIFPLYGIEIIALLTDLQSAGVKINDPGNPGKMYICGKGITQFDPLTPHAAELLQVIRRNDSARMSAMIDRLAALFASAGIETDLDADAVKDQVVRRHGCAINTVYLQERHVAQAFQEALFQRVEPPLRPAMLERLFTAPPKTRTDDAVGIQNEIRSHLMKAGRPAYVDETFVDFDHAYRLILALGGIPCYPTLADGGGTICPFETPVDKLIASIKGRGIYAAEFIPIRNRPEVLLRYVTAMRDAGLVVTAGTEHNTRDLLPLEPTCVDGIPISAEVAAIFYEGACLVAAHQHLRALQKPGFVDEHGKPCAGFASDEDRIRTFSSLGAEVIQGCLSATPQVATASPRSARGD
jgi:hypothetical protein